MAGEMGQKGKKKKTHQKGPKGERAPRTTPQKTPIQLKKGKKEGGEVYGRNETEIAWGRRGSGKMGPQVFLWDGGKYTQGIGK